MADPPPMQLASLSSFGGGIALFHTVDHRVIGAKTKRHSEQ